MKRVYLDYAATTPMDKEVEKAMRSYCGEIFGNPGSVHSFGQEASRAVFTAHEQIARALGCKYNEVIFTGSASEANNLALRGAFAAIFQNRGLVFPAKTSRLALGEFPAERDQANSPPRHSEKQHANAPLRLITSKIEHSSVLATCKDLEENWGVEVVYLPVDRGGLVGLKKLKEELNERTVLVSIGMVNSEIGVVQPIAEIGRMIGEFRDGIVKKKSVISTESASWRRSGEISSSSKKQIIEISPARNALHSEAGGRQARDDGVMYPLFHTDAVQAFQFLKCDVEELGVDLMTLSAHKIYGPKGVGALFARNPKKILNPIITGGGQEWGLRAGTENVAGVVGFGKAVELAEAARTEEVKRIGGLRDYFWQELKKIVPDIEVNGWFNEKGARMRSLDKLEMTNMRRVPNNLNIYFPGRPAQDLIIELDLAGVAASTVSACSARAAQPSHVIEALRQAKDSSRKLRMTSNTGGDDRPTSSIRFSLGKFTTQEEIDYVLEVLRNRFN
ncbi:MAG: cysteine desulfurase family protein [Patescibacteria group bacterium]